MKTDNDYFVVRTFFLLSSTHRLRERMFTAGVVPLTGGPAQTLCVGDSLICAPVDKRRVGVWRREDVVCRTNELWRETRSFRSVSRLTVTLCSLQSRVVGVLPTESYHRKRITALAISDHARRPVVATASKDALCLWRIAVSNLLDVVAEDEDALARTIGAHSSLYACVCPRSRIFAICLSTSSSYENVCA